MPDYNKEADEINMEDLEAAGELYDAWKADFEWDEDCDNWC